MLAILYVDKEHLSFVGLYKSKVASGRVSIITRIANADEHWLYGAPQNADAILIASATQLRAYLKKPGSLDNYAGSFEYRVHPLTGKKIMVLILPPIDYVVTVPHGVFLHKHYLSKLWSQDFASVSNPFRWHKVTDPLADLSQFRTWQPVAIAVDIETSGQAGILCVGFAFLFENNTMQAFTVPYQGWEYYTLIKEILASPYPKVFQNGLYDNAHLLRNRLVAHNWLWDTMGLFHAWYSELPKDLAFLSAFCIREHMYWKHESAEDVMQYNGKDCWNTMLVFKYLLTHMPDWARKNYSISFPLVFPALCCSLSGLRVDKERHESARAEFMAQYDSALKSLRTMLSLPTFNPASSKQVVGIYPLLFDVPKNWASSSDDVLEKIAALHPINMRIVRKLQEVRKAKKLLSTYFDTDLCNGRFLYSLNPFGTVTGRFSSSASAFWCGTQIQNIPPIFRKVLAADKGFVLYGVDNSQSESRCTAYLSDDEEMIAAVEAPGDFHCNNGALFFGCSPEEVRTRGLRELAKRINHGANYNMGPAVLLSTMGEKLALEAKRLLQLPARLSLLEVAENLLQRFNRAYPKVKSRWYASLIREVAVSRMLTSPSGWTRYFFGDTTQKAVVNKIVAHGPQHLSVWIVNQGFLRCYNELQGPNFQLKAQIHDEVFFQVQIGHEHLVRRVQELMRIPVTVPSGKTFTIPTDVKGGKTHWEK